jgi:peptide methionine sulfoxide reductase MsrA
MTEERAILAGGCFWGVQDLIRRYDGILSTRIGSLRGQTFISRLSSALSQSMKMQDLRTVGFAFENRQGRSRHIPDRRSGNLKGLNKT